MTASSPVPRLAGRLMPWLAALLPFAAVACAYAFHMGRGFVKDDFAWIAQSRADSTAELLALFQRDNGFYRPLVALSFALDQRFFGLWPYGYALTNLALALACMATLVALGAALGLPRWQRLLWAGLWGLNPHGVGGAVMWISGRTALLLVLCSLLAALALLRGQRAALVLGLQAALFAKEEALLLPAVLAAWAALRAGPGSARWRCAAEVLLLSAAPLVVYGLLRQATGAFLPHTAPPHYRLSAAPLLVLRNAAEYADRAATLAAAAVLATWLVVRRRPDLDGQARRVLWMAALWVAGGFGLTLFLPVRSSLYACLPAVGTTLAGTALVAGLVPQASARQRSRLLALGLAAPALLLPLLWSRNARLANLARLSSHTLAAVAQIVPRLDADGVAVLHDSPERRTSLAQAFGTLLPEATALTLGASAAARVWIEPPPVGWDLAGLRRPSGKVAAEYALRDGRLWPGPPR